MEGILLGGERENIFLMLILVLLLGGIFLLILVLLLLLLLLVIVIWLVCINLYHYIYKQTSEDIHNNNGY